MREVVVHEFIAALRQLQRPLVSLAVAILLLQTLVAGLASAHIAGQIATFGADAVICHGNGEDGSTPVQKAAHDCCTFCTNAGPVALSPTAPVIAHLTPERAIARADDPADGRPARRAIRAGPSQAPPNVA
jgi:hypothetical protein